MNNRVIKFRVWDNKAKLFTFDYLIHQTGKIFVMYVGHTLVDPSHENYVIQQFTGLSDSKGKEIYEGDILFCSTEQMMKNNTPIIYKSNYYGVVEYDAPSFVLRDIAKMSPMFWAGCEIIGNIFENPEMLK